jgi:hypothetical protein
MGRNRKRDNEEDVVDLVSSDEHEDEAPKKRTKKRASADTRPKETREDQYGHTVRYSSKPSIKVQERIQRAMPNSGHRLFLIDRQPDNPAGAEGGRSEDFKVLGATGNVYTVRICRQPSCNCPDANRGNVCKHRLFVMLRVLRLPRDNGILWQRALLASEVEEVLGGDRGGAAADTLASHEVREQFRRVTGGGGGSTAPATPMQRPIQAGDAECPVCQDEMDSSAFPSSPEAVTFCADCGNSVHRHCIGMWTRSRRGQGLEVTCPLCRAPWRDGNEPTAGLSQPLERGYLNLKESSQAHRHVDTSLEGLYGDRALWIQANRGQVSRGAAAATWRAMHGA